jgi:membrane protein DedA with SNARE-associated domain
MHPFPLAGAIGLAVFLVVRRQHLGRATFAVGAVVVAALALWGFGVVEPPNLTKLIEDVGTRLGKWTYLLVGALAFLETGAFVGLVAPGETAIVLGGVVAAEGGVDLPVIVLVAWLAAALGDLASFALGQRLGRRFLVSRGPRLGVTAPRLERVEEFFDRHGPKAILVGRFIGIVRAVAPFLAGASGMRLRDFLPWSLLGTFLWATAFTLVGYAFHASFASAAHTLTHAAFGAAVLAAALLAFRAHRQARAATA